MHAKWRVSLHSKGLGFRGYSTAPLWRIPKSSMTRSSRPSLVIWETTNDFSFLLRKLFQGHWYAYLQMAELIVKLREMCKLPRHGWVYVITPYYRRALTSSVTATYVMDYLLHCRTIQVQILALTSLPWQGSLFKCTYQGDINTVYTNDHIVFEFQQEILMTLYCWETNL